MADSRRVLIVGSGGREHALAWKLQQSPGISALFCLPGNAGTAAVATNLEGVPSDHSTILRAVQEQAIDLVVIGPDDCLAAGLADDLQRAGIAAFGPTQSAARLESSKVFAKAFMERHGIPTAQAGIFDDPASARAFADSQNLPLVIKAEGLALGKGVIIAETRAAVAAAIHQIMVDKAFGTAGERVVIEEFLTGQECSIHAFISEGRYQLCPAAQDHKRIGEGDIGPNTGGMGTCCPTPVVDGAAMARIEEEVIKPFVSGCQEEGIDFRGMLFPGLMMTAEGPKVLEFNCRFGDPEAQVLVRLLESDLLPLLEATIEGTLDTIKPEWSSSTAICIVMASGGYPGSYGKGYPISGIATAEALDSVVVFHAGTKAIDGEPVTSGGRVLGVTALGRTLSTAREAAYSATATIHFEGCQYRRDLPTGR